jgi:hypothetical protein
MPDAVTVTKPVEVPPAPAAPAAPVVVPPTAEPSASSTDLSDDDWGNLSDALDDQTHVEEVPAAPVTPAPEPTPAPAAEVAPTVPVVAPVSTPETPPATTLPEAPASAPSGPEAAQGQPETPPQQPATITPEQMQATWVQREHTLAQQYQISEEQGDEILKNPEKALPALAAKIQASTEQAVWHNLRAVLPQLIAGVQQQTANEQTAKDALYVANPTLKTHVDTNPPARAVVERMRTLFMQQNPNIDAATLNRQVAAAAMVALGIPFNPQSTQQPVPVLGASQPVPPHVPAGAQGSAPVGQQQSPKLGAIEAYAQSIMEDDSGNATVF